jgi:hypothetical protein
MVRRPPQAAVSNHEAEASPRVEFTACMLRDATLLGMRVEAPFPASLPHVP